MGAFASIKLCGTFSGLVSKVDYTKLSICVLAFLTAMVAAFAGLMGVLVAATGACIGFMCIRSGARMGSCMGVLMVPSIVFFSGQSPVIFSLVGI
jgi:TctA family transporter